MAEDHSEIYIMAAMLLCASALVLTSMAGTFLPFPDGRDLVEALSQLVGFAEAPGAGDLPVTARVRTLFDELDPSQAVAV